MKKLQFKVNGESFAKKRINLIKFILLFFIPGVIVIKLFVVQVWQYKTFLPLVKKQILSNVKISIPRGDIFDRRYKILATNLEFENISVNSSEFLKGLEKNRNNLILLSQTINVSQEEILKKCYKEKYFSLNCKVELTTSFKLKKIRGLDFVKISERFYPNNDLGRYVLGGVDKENKGYSGIEREFENLLSNTRSKELFVYKNGNINNTSLRLASLSDIEEVENRTRNYSIVLTIDSKLQYIVEKILQDAYEKFLPKKVMCIVQDPNTAEIIVMASYPPMEKPLSNPLISSAFEPGSTFKIFPMAMFLEENVVTKDTILNCENGKFYYAGNEISDLKPHKQLSVKDIIVYSSNIGMAKTYLELNNPWKYCSFLKLFGFGTLSGIELPGELKGWIITPFNIKWSNYQPIAMSIGQGIFVTAMQMVNAYSAIANGGELLQPQIVKHILDNNGEIIHTNKKAIIRKVISTKTAEAIKDMLEETVLRGTVTGTKVDGITICAKTGTAQKYDPQIKKYSNTKSLISTCGFFPKENPKYVIGLFFDEPKNGGLASDVAVPVFKKIVLEILDTDYEIKYAKAN